MALIIPFFINLSSTACVNNEYSGLNTSEESLTETLTPNGNKKNEWDVSHYEYIKEEGGDKNSQCGHDEEKIDIFKMTAPELDREVVSITVNLKCKCQTFSLGYAMIEVSYKLGCEGIPMCFNTWSTVKSVHSQFGLAWKSFTWTGLSANPLEMSNLEIKLKAKIHATGIGGWVYVDAMNVEIEYINSVKIGVFFWAGDSADPVAGETDYETYADRYIDEYIHKLKGRGYTKIFEFKDTSDLNELNKNFKKIDDYEFEEDIIFFYFSGHGLKNLGVKLNSDEYHLNHYRLRLKLETLESERIGFLVDACQSGYFVDQFNDKNYLTISSADSDHDSGGNENTHESYFSYYFWKAITDGNDAYAAYFHAVWWNDFLPWWPAQYPMYDNNLFEQTGYMFFED